MVRIDFYMVQNDRGQELYDDYIQPICNKLGVDVVPSAPGATRWNSAASQFRANYVLWDGSVEQGHIYNAFNEVAKSSSKHAIISRTPLPRNVLMRRQFAPIHGETFSNDMLGEWFKKYLYGILSGNSYPLGSSGFNNKALANYYWWGENPADVFLSFRGSQQKAAEDWCQQFTARTKRTVRMVPKRQYAYEYECMPRQQMWEVVACLWYEMRATGSFALFLSDDYFDSFWTCSELLARIKYRGTQNAYITEDSSSTELSPLRIATSQFPVPPLTRLQSKRLQHILNNSDPRTAAPESQIPLSSPLGKLWIFLMRTTIGHYGPDFIGDSFWKTVQVPCPYCRPKNRLPEQVDWGKHLFFETLEKVDVFGYFPVAPEKLPLGTVRCPNCNQQIQLKNDRPPRTLWAPILSTEQNQSRPVIRENPVWEVVD